MKMVTVRLKEELYRGLKLYCASHNLTMQSTMNYLVSNLINETQKPHETISKLHETSLKLHETPLKNSKGVVK